MTITMGWWLLPLAITLVAFVWALPLRESDRRSGDYDFMFWLPWAARTAGAIIVALVAWLIWSLAR